jgi:hypothetical protein
LLCNGVASYISMIKFANLNRALLLDIKIDDKTDFSHSNLIGVKWIDGTHCGPRSSGQCVIHLLRGERSRAVPRGVHPDVWKRWLREVMT